jgi:hypothetical protein
MVLATRVAIVFCRRVVSRLTVYNLGGGVAGGGPKKVKSAWAFITLGKRKTD